MSSRWVPEGSLPPFCNTAYTSTCDQLIAIMIANQKGNLGLGIPVTLVCVKRLFDIDYVNKPNRTRLSASDYNGRVISLMPVYIRRSGH